MYTNNFKKLRNFKISKILECHLWNVNELINHYVYKFASWNDFQSSVKRNFY